LLFFPAVLLLLFGSLLAIETGEIKGTVTDEDGAPLPGVSITLRSDSLQGPRTAVTETDGTFRFPLLPVGRYDVTYEIKGFERKTEQGYVVRLGFTLTLETKLKLSAVEEEVVVTAHTPIIDKTKTDTSYRMNADDLAQAPSQARTIQDIVKYTPGVTGVRADTMNGTGQGLPSFRGEGQEGNNWLVDGLSVRGARVRDQGVEINFDSWEEVQIISDGFTPDLGSTMGGIINIVTKSGGNAFHGELGALVQDWHLRADRQAQLGIATEPDTSLHQYYGNIGGPIIKDRLWFFLSNDFHRRMDDTTAGASVGWLTFPSGKRRLNTNNAFGKLTLSLGVNHTLGGSGTLDKFLKQTGGTGLPELYTKSTYKDWAYRVNYKGILSTDMFIEAAFGQANQDLSRDPLNNDFDTPQYYYYDIAQYTNNASGARINVEKRTDASARLTYYLDSESLGKHELSGGVSYYKTYGEDGQDYSGRAFDPFPGNGFENGVAIDWLERGAPFIMTEYGPYGFFNKTNGIGLYLRDKVTVDRFTLMLGVRSETQQVWNDLGDIVWKWNLGDFISPRASLAIDVTKDGKNVLKLAYGRFADTAGTRIAENFNAHAGLAYRQYDWAGGLNPTDADLKNGANWAFSHEQSSASNPMYFDPNLHPNRLNRFLVEFDRQLSADWGLIVRGTYSKSKDLLDDVVEWKDNAFWQAHYDAYPNEARRNRPYGFWYWQLQNFSAKRRDYKSVEVELNGRIADKFWVNASYVWSQAKGTNPGQFDVGSWTATSGSSYDIGIFGDHPVIPDDNPYNYLDEMGAGLGSIALGDEGWYGFLPYSVDHNVKILGTYFAPMGIVVTSAVEYISGYHWQKLGLNELYGGYYNYPETRGVRTTPAHVYVDLSVQKDFAIGNGMEIGLRLNANNLFNSQKPVSLVQEGTSLFGQVWGRQDPRWLQFQVLFKW
ncbi:MAG: TonB-dependent receptor, partial [Candidatus Aminicenantales bacterium]